MDERGLGRRWPWRAHPTRTARRAAPAGSSGCRSGRSGLPDSSAASAAAAISAASAVLARDRRPVPEPGLPPRRMPARIGAPAWSRRRRPRFRPPPIRRGSRPRSRRWPACDATRLRFGVDGRLRGRGHGRAEVGFDRRVGGLVRLARRQRRSRVELEDLVPVPASPGGQRDAAGRQQSRDERHRPDHQSSHRRLRSSPACRPSLPSARHRRGGDPGGWRCRRVAPPSVGGGQTSLNSPSTVSSPSAARPRRSRPRRPDGPAPSPVPLPPEPASAAPDGPAW